MGRCRYYWIVAREPVHGLFGALDDGCRLGGLLALDLGRDEMDHLGGRQNIEDAVDKFGGGIGNGRIAKIDPRRLRVTQAILSPYDGRTYLLWREKNILQPAR